MSQLNFDIVEKCNSIEKLLLTTKLDTYNDVIIFLNKLQIIPYLNDTNFLDIIQSHDVKCVSNEKSQSISKLAEECQNNLNSVEGFIIVTTYLVAENKARLIENSIRLLHQTLTSLILNFKYMIS